jgi:hypothetical protein
MDWPAYTAKAPGSTSISMAGSFINMNTTASLGLTTPPKYQRHHYHHPPIQLLLRTHQQPTRKIPPPGATDPETEDIAETTTHHQQGLQRNEEQHDSDRNWTQTLLTRRTTAAMMTRNSALSVSCIQSLHGNKVTAAQNPTWTAGLTRRRAAVGSNLSGSGTTTCYGG